MANRDIINQVLKKYLLDVVFPKSFKKYSDMLWKKHRSYMVIIGGVSVEMCARLDTTAQSFLKSVFSEDIDIKLVVANINADYEAIHELRLKFVNDVIKRLSKYIMSHKKEWDASIDINVHIDDALLNHKIDAVANARVVSIGVEYVEGKYHTIYPLVDTTFFTEASTPHFGVFQKIMKSKTPVPYYVANGVNYANCEYMMYDNCRMLVDRASYLKEKKSLFALMKFTKYIIKFMSLYVLRKKVEHLPTPLLEIYDEAYYVLKKINTFKLKNGFKQMYSIKYDSKYVDMIVSRLETIIKASDMKSLIKAATSITFATPPP